MVTSILNSLLKYLFLFFEKYLSEYSEFLKNDEPKNFKLNQQSIYSGNLRNLRFRINNYIMKLNSESDKELTI